MHRQAKRIGGLLTLGHVLAKAAQKVQRVEWRSSVSCQRHGGIVAIVEDEGFVRSQSVMPRDGRLCLLV